jgi:hypothetical protein
VPKQRITAVEKQKEIKPLTTNLKGRTMNPLTQSKNTTILPVLIALTLGCFALSPRARAVCQNGCAGNNTFLGEDALINGTGFENTAIGYHALFQANGSNNTAIGNGALFADTLGNINTANGAGALQLNTTGSGNTATGYVALFSNTNGGFNTAVGFNALNASRSASYNTAIGFNALSRTTTGGHNIAVGKSAGANLTIGDHNIDIGNPGAPGESSTIRMGRAGEQTATFIAGINGVTVPNGVGVIIDTNGQLGTIVSSKRFKDAVEPMDKASEAILALKPVAFRYKKELDPDGTPQFGLVAEEVEKVSPDLVARDEQGEPYTVRYEAVNAMLLNEFLKEHRKNEKQETTIADLKAEIAALSATVKEQSAQIQRVSAQLEMSKFATGRIRLGGPAPQTIANNQ